MAWAGNKRKQANDFFIAGYLWGREDVIAGKPRSYRNAYARLPAMLL